MFVNVTTFQKRHEFSLECWNCIKLLIYQSDSFFIKVLNINQNDESLSKGLILIKGMNFHQGEVFISKSWILLSNGFSSKWWILINEMNVHQSDEFSSECWMIINMKRFHQSVEFSSKVSIFINSSISSVLTVLQSVPQPQFRLSMAQLSLSL